ncbi:hypothetical protein [Candidatus Laterigemmans baculatus]|uniref:hypothetical protein n=1 Tax=Candidatus Laterigemmans baculatus TaxID=2770505 RepID=UPI0013DC2E34|nr:hypothetical protein [Candidatus Laterigemmans baculatus]
MNREDDTSRQSRWAEWAVFVVCFCLACFFFAVQVGRRDGLSAPPQPFDSLDYDALAVQIAKGNGFSFDFRDPDFQRPYLAAADGERSHATADVERDRIYQQRLADPLHGPTTFRPPGLPAVMAAIYQTAGRQFALVRLLNCAAMAAAISLTLVCAYRAAGLVAVVVGLFCGTIVDSVRPYISGDILSEPLATLAITVVFVLQLHYIRGPSLRRAVGIGGALGVAVLFRTAFVLWLPVLLLAMVLPVPHSLRQVGWRRRLVDATVTAVVLAACVAPWAVRNSLLLEEFKPLGLHGEINLAVAYSDRALQGGGLWYNPLPEDPAAVAALPDRAVEREQWLAEQSRREAGRWLAENWRQVPRLIVARVRTEWWPTSRREILLLLLVAVGLVLYPRRDEQWLMVCFLVAASVAVAASWSVGGRFTVPVRPLMYAAAGVGAARVVQWVRGLAPWQNR